MSQQENNAEALGLLQYLALVPGKKAAGRRGTGA
jgi:hypothetical protein